MKIRWVTKVTYLERLQKYKWLEFDDIRLYKSTGEIIDTELKIENSLFNETEQEKLRVLIKKYYKVFSSFGEIGEFKQKVVLEFTEHPPLAKRGYPIPKKYRKAVDNEVSRLIALGKLQEAGDSVRNFSVAFPVVKKTLSESNKPKIYIIIDLRLLNSYTI